MGAHACLRRLLPAAAAGLLATMLALLPAPPVHASIGGSAEATGLRALAPEVRLQVTTSGAASRVQPILDVLTRDPVLSGREVISAEVATPEAPSGVESETVPGRTVPGVLSVDEITARTERVEDGELSAQARTGELQLSVLGLDVLQVGEVHARSLTHPSDDPAAVAQAPDVTAFGREVSVPADEPIEIDESLSTTEALEALEEAFPGLQSLVSALGGAFEAGGGIQVQMGRSTETDPMAGSASALGFYASVDLDLDVDICIPNFSGGCAAQVHIRTDARVIDLVLAETSVERPNTLPIVERINWAVMVPVTAAVALALFALGLGLGRWRRKDDRSGP